MNRPRPSGEPRTHARRSPRHQARERAPEPGRAADVRLTREIEDALAADEFDRMLAEPTRDLRERRSNTTAVPRGWPDPWTGRFA